MTDYEAAFRLDHAHTDSDRERWSSVLGSRLGEKRAEFEGRHREARESGAAFPAEKVLREMAVLPQIEAVEKLIERFDFEACEKYMRDADWRWGEAAPSKDDMREMVRHLAQSVLDGY